MSGSQGAIIRVSQEVVFFQWLNSMVFGRYTLWLFNIAMENGPFIVDFPIKTSIYEGFSMAMLNNQMVTIVNGDYFMVYKPTYNWGAPSCTKWRCLLAVKRNNGKLPIDGLFS